MKSTHINVWHLIYIKLLSSRPGDRMITTSRSFRPLRSDRLSFNASLVQSAHLLKWRIAQLSRTRTDSTIECRMSRIVYCETSPRSDSDIYRSIRLDSSRNTSMDSRPNQSTSISHSARRYISDSKPRWYFSGKIHRCYRCAPVNALLHLHKISLSVLSMILYVIPLIP